jgi:hypothetical protein
MEGLKILRKAREASGLAIVTEAMSKRCLADPLVLLCPLWLRPLTTRILNATPEPDDVAAVAL